MFAIKVLLINPPARRFVRFHGPCFPLGLGYIAAVLIKDGHQVEIYDAEWNADIERKRADTQYPLYYMASNWYKYRLALRDPAHEVWQEVEGAIRERDPGVVGITARALDLASALILARITKFLNSKIVVVLGGPAATTCTNMVLEDHNVDFVVRQEGEITMSELLKALEKSSSDYRSIEGLSFRQGENIIHNNPRLLIEDIDSLPYPARDRLLYPDRLPRATAVAMMGDIVTSRGCPYHCSFCANFSIWGSRKPRMRTAQDCVEEIMYLKDNYNVHSFAFWDDLFTINRQRVMEICNLLLEKKAFVHWSCMARVDTIDDEMLKLMKRAGCTEVQLGVESGSDRILAKIKKGFTVQQVRKAVNSVKENKISLRMFLMIGFPGETKSEMGNTVALINQLKPNIVELSVFAVYPGSPLHEELKNKGLLNSTDWMFSDFLNVDHCYIEGMSDEEFRNLALRYLKECDKYNNLMNKPRTRYAYYARHPVLLANRLVEKFFT